MLKGRVPLFSEATRDQYPVHTFLSPESHPARHSTPYRSGLPSFSDQKLKLRDDMSRIQSSTDLLRGSERLWVSEGHRWRGWVRHVRGVYDSTRSFCRIYTGYMEVGTKGYSEEGWSIWCVLTCFAASFTPSSLIWTKSVALRKGGLRCKQLGLHWEDLIHLVCELRRINNRVSIFTILLYFAQVFWFFIEWNCCSTCVWYGRWCHLNV